MLKIVLDAFGGDNAPEATVRGGIAALKESDGFSLVLTGKAETINKIIDAADCGDIRSRIEVADCSEVITNEESPTVAIRKKADSSLVVGLKYLKEDPDCKAFVSAGSTGAVLTGATLKVGRIKGVSRPALAPVLPTVSDGNVMLIDCGANADCKPINLVHFAVMGSNYMNAMFGIERPRVAILSNGTEDHKGNMLTQEVFGALKSVEGINFVGNMEARDVLSGKYDVIVSDGFSGNVCLKSMEGMSVSMMNLIMRGVKTSLRAKIGAWLLKPVLKGLMKKLDYNSNGGAVFLGVEGLIFKAHGAATEKTVKKTLLQAKAAAEGDLVERIRTSLASVDFENLVKAE
ncbi:MAG: phosphate acyltransferase PlsX [Clostridia bacterium]|nr:phosphate acyltransferase PlsX [Clostridia bacterium]